MLPDVALTRQQHAHRVVLLGLVGALGGFVIMTCLAVAALAVIFGPRGRGDPVLVLVCVLGVTFVAWMFYRQVRRAWIRHP